MELSKSICQLPLLVLPHLRPLGTSVGGKLLGTGAACIVTAYPSVVVVVVVVVGGTR